MPTKNKKILIIEDEKPMARAMDLKLKKAGFDTKVVFDGEEAVKELSEGKYDLAVLDLVMPKMGGFAVLEELKIKNIKVPVIVVSNLSQEEDEKKARELGAKDFLIKSNIPIATIVEKIKGYL